MNKNLAVIIATIIILLFIWGFSPLDKSSDFIEVSTMTPQTTTIYDYVNADGRVIEGNKNNIYTDAFTKLEKLYVDIGDIVKKGDPLAEISTYSIKNTKELTDNLSDIDYTYISDIIYNSLEDINTVPKKILHDKNDTTVKSPIDGTITAVGMQIGDTAIYPQKLISVSDLSDIYINALVPESALLKIKEGNKVKISPNTDDNVFAEGVIDTIYPIAKYIPSLTDKGQAYINTKIKINRPKNFLRPGLTVNAQIIAKKSDNRLIIPYECINQDESGREFVFCLKDGIIKKNFITTGYELENYVEVKQGINKDSKIIINPSNAELKENMSAKEKNPK